MSAALSVSGLESVTVQVQTKCQWSDEVVKDAITGKFAPVGQICGKPTKAKANGLRHDFCSEHIEARKTMYADRRSTWKARAELSAQRKAAYHDSMAMGIMECQELLNDPTAISMIPVQSNTGRIALIYTPAQRSDSFSWHAKQAPTSVAQLSGPKKESANFMLGITAWLPNRGSFVLLLDQSSHVFGTTKDVQFACAEIMKKHVSGIQIANIG